MKDVTVLTNLLSKLYGAEIISDEEASRWVDDNEKVIIGYCFPDLKLAYPLLAAQDITLLTESQHRTYTEELKYPFMSMVAIVYLNKYGELDLRVTNGISSNIFKAFKAWKSLD